MRGLGAARVEQIMHRYYLQAIFRDTQQEYIKNQLQAALIDAEIKHIFIKGAVLKADYPVPALRTMCDLDVLVYAKDFDRIEYIAKVLGGKAMAGDGNHRNFCFFDCVFVEFHPNLLHHATHIGTDINPGWQYEKKESTTCSSELTEEGFYLNTICHLANHFVEGGVGVRFLMDVWVNRHLRKPEANRTFVVGELERFGLLDFAEKIEQLAEAWFGNQAMTPLLDEMGMYILTSGSHGTAARAMLNTMSLSAGGNRASALWAKAFYPKAELEDRFPWCKGKSLLLPAAWCVRAFRATTKHRDIVLNWIKGTEKISKNEVSENREMLRRFGLDKAFR